MAGYSQSTAVLFLFHVLIGLIIASGAIADEVYLQNGDRVSGLLKELDEEHVVVTTTYAGEVKILRQKVDTLVTDTSVVVVFENNDVLTGRLELSQEKSLQLQTDRFGTFGPFRLGHIKTIHRHRDVLHFQKSTGAVTTQRSADEVHLKSGDRLIGTIKEINAEHVIVSTDYAGELKLKRQSVIALATKQPVTVIFQNGDYITGRVSPSPENMLQIDSGRGGSFGEFELTEVKELYREDPRQVVRTREQVKLSGRVNVGLNMTSGNSDIENYHADGRLRARTPKNRYTVGAEFNREKSEGERTANNVLGFLKYDHFLTKKWFLFNSATFEHDEFKDLNLRTSIGLGIGYQFFETEDLFLSAEGGLTYVNEDFDVATDDDYPGARWALEYEQGILKWVRLFHNHEVLSGTDVKNLFLRTRSGLRFPLANKFNATAELGVDWDRSPPDGSTSTDKKYLFGLGYEW